MSVKREDIHNFKYFEYGEAFYGSDKGLRYRIGIEPLENVFYASKEDKEKHTIKAYVWSEPFNFSVTKDKLSKEFSFSEEGVAEAVAWINEMRDSVVNK